MVESRNISPEKLVTLLRLPSLFGARIIMKRPLRNPILFLLAMLIVLPSVPARAASPAQVDAAIKKAKAYLRSKQSKDGSWMPEEAGTQFGGHTAIATNALLAGGDSPQDEHIKRAVAWLSNAKITGIYALGLRAQVWTYLKPGAERRAAIKRDAELLLKSTDEFGRWGYTVGGGGQHNSPTQYGVLGLWACARTGYEIPTKFWAASEKGWLACQCKDGGWQYK